jgi:hypothetical protein
MMDWDEGWETTKGHFRKFWNRDGLVVVAGMWERPFDLEDPRDRMPEPEEPDDPEAYWLDPGFRAAKSRWELARIPFGPDGFPFASSQVGPGSLALYLGARGGFSKETVWFEPVLDGLDDPIRLDPKNPYWLAQLAVVDRMRGDSRGEYGVALPDLVEGLDILASLRGNEDTMLDMLERPAAVKRALAEIDTAWIEAYDGLWERASIDGGSAFWAFGLWSDGKVAKLQCDASAMFSNPMFEEFAVPGLERQCRFLDRSLYHLDGTQAMRHLDSLLAIDDLDAIEWTAQAGIEGGGNERWYPLYRRILEAGKSVQALDVRTDEIGPLLDAIGTRGVYVSVEGVAGREDLDEVDRIVRRYRTS